MNEDQQDEIEDGIRGDEEANAQLKEPDVNLDHQAGYSYLSELYRR